MAKVAGHRGMGKGLWNGILAENTPESVRVAIDLGADLVEVDARLTRCGSLVSHHDPYLPDGTSVRDATVDQCRDAGLHPLTDLLTAAGRVPVNIDVKTSTADAESSWEYSTGGRLTALLLNYPHPQPVLVTSFDPSVPVRMRQDLPGVRFGLLGWPTYPLRKLLPAATHLGLTAVAFDYSSTRENSIDRSSEADVPHLAETFRISRNLGIATLCYGVPADAVAGLFLAGLDIACVDDVPAAIAARDAHLNGETAA